MAREKYFDTSIDDLYDVENETRNSIKKTMAPMWVLLVQVSSTNTSTHCMDLTFWNIWYMMFDSNLNIEVGNWYNRCQSTLKQS